MTSLAIYAASRALRPPSAELARARRLVLQSFRLAARLHDRARLRRSSGATVRRGATPGLVVVSIVTLHAGRMTTTSAAGLAPGLRDAASAHLDLAKQDLGLARLAHFAALAYLIAIAPGLTRVIDGRLGRAVQSLGRNGLAIFAAGSSRRRSGAGGSRRGCALIPP